MTAQNGELDERELPDEYPIRVGYLYVVDGEVVRAKVRLTAGEFRALGAKSVKNCDVKGRNLWDLMI